MSESQQQIKLSLPRFEGDDFSVWKIQVEAYLTTINKAWVLKQTSPRHRAEYKEAEAGLKDAKQREIEKFNKDNTYVRSLLLLALDNKHVKIVMKCGSAKDIWDRLGAIHEQKSAASKISLQKEFFEIQLNKGENVQDYIARAEYLHGKLQDLGVDVNTQTLVSKIVSGLPKRFLSFMSTWSNLDPTKQTMPELVARLMAEESLMSKFWKPKVENALHSEDDKKKGKAGRSNNQQQQNKKGQNQGNEKGSDQAKQKKPKTCYKCGDPNHLKVNCPVLKKEKEKKEESKPAEGGKEGILVASEEACAAWSSNQWICDSGATSSMTPDRTDFDKYETLSTPRRIRFGNNQVAMAVGIGNVKMPAIVDGKVGSVNIQEVLHVPDLRRKLISLSKATQRGCKVMMESTGMAIMDREGDVILKAKRQDGLFVAQLFQEEAHIAVTEEELWHQRFGHINQKTLCKTSGVVEGMPKLKNEVGDGPGESIKCVSCTIGKQPKKPYKLRRSRATEVGERVHADICGPTGVETSGGARYFILFKDEFSNYRFIYMMQSRVEAYDCLRKTHARIVAETTKPMRCVVSDCGSEFTSDRTQEFLVANKIIHVKSAPNTPAQNGFIERDNRTVMEGVRSMLAARKVEPRFWGEAASTFIHVLNRSVNRNVPVTPFELYFNKRPNVDYFRVFGCLAMAKTPTKKRSGYQKKLEARSSFGMLTGYEADYTYRIYDAVSRKIEITREVVFDESKTLSEAPSDYAAIEAFIDSMLEDDIEDGDGSENSGGEDSAGDELEETQEPIREGPRLRSHGPSALLTEAHVEEPVTRREALRSPEASQWQDAMVEEYKSHMTNGTWELVKLPKDRQPITCRWTFKLKRKTDGSIDRFKARLVARGFTQRHGIDYVETFSPVVRMDSVRILIVLAHHYKYEMLQLDVKTAFLYGDLSEEIFMRQPEGFEEGDEAMVCKLKKSIYGLKQASRNWNRCFSEFLKSFNLVRLMSDTCVFASRGCNLADTTKPALIICIYVDDGLLMSNSSQLLASCVEHLKSKFEIRTSQPEYFVGLQITKLHDKLLIHQSSYISSVLERFEMTGCRPSSVPMAGNTRMDKEGMVGSPSKQVNVPYQQAIGSLMYAAIGTRPDIAYATNFLARFSSGPRLSHWNAVKNVLRYVASTPRRGIVCGRSEGLSLKCFSDSDYGGCLDTRRSTSGVLITLNTTPIVWKSHKQKRINGSTCEAEYVAAALAAREVIWVTNFLSELGLNLKPARLLVDNSGTVKLVKNDQIHEKTKHLAIKLHFLREANGKEIAVEHIPGEDQLADVFTKPLARKRFEQLVGQFCSSGDQKEEEAHYAVEMETPIRLIVALLVVNPACGFLLRERWVVRPHHVVLRDGHSCDFILDKTLIQEWTNRKAAEVDKRPTVCRSPMLIEWDYCIFHANKLQKVVEDLPSNVVVKRSVAAQLAVHTSKLAKRVIAGATIFLKGMAKEVLDDTANEAARQLLKTLVGVGQEQYVNKTIVPEGLARDEISVVSIFAKERAPQLDAVVAELNYEDKYIRYSHEEMSAAEALLRSIASYLSKGKVDTQALGELIEDKFLMDIDPESTKVTTVVRDWKAGLTHFYFDELIELSKLDRVIWADVIACIGLSSVLTLMALAAWLRRWWMKKVREQTKTENRVFELGKRIEDLQIDQEFSRRGLRTPEDVESVRLAGSSGDVELRSMASSHSALVGRPAQ